MAQITSGIRSVFSHPAIYNLAQRMVGAEKARRILVRDYFPRMEGRRMLDIGCGTAEILRHLPARMAYVGFDASAAYIVQAKARFGERGIFRAELVREATLEGMQGFDLVLAFGLLHHLDDDEADMLFALAASALVEGGSLLTIDPVYVAGQAASARWMISKDRGQNIRSPEAYRALAEKHFTDVTVSVRHDLLYIPYSHAILQCRTPCVR